MLTNILSSPVLSNLPSYFKSVAEVVGLLHLVESTRICKGNSCGKSLEVAVNRGGVFKNRSGKIF